MMPLPPASPLTAALARRVAAPPPPNAGQVPYQTLARPMHSGALPVPRNDAELMGMIQNSKATLDHHAGLNRNAHPALQQVFQSNRQKHIDAVANAVHAYHKATPTTASANIVRAMHSDPNLKITAPMPPLE